MAERYSGWYRLAWELKMPLRQCMKRVSHREFLGWLHWLEEQRNVPSRADYYAMQIAARIVGGSIDAQRIEFKPKQPVKETVEQAQAIAIARVGGKVTRAKRSRT